VLFSPTSAFSGYDSDFDDESDTEQDGESDEEEVKSATSEMQTEVAPEITVSEEATATPVLHPEENLNEHSMEGVEDVKEEALSEGDSTGLTTGMAPSWQSSNTSDPSLPGNLSVITDSQMQTKTPRVPPKALATTPGPPKVKIEVKDVAYRTYFALLHYVSEPLLEGELF
jgi:hypothetical protein